MIIIHVLSMIFIVLGLLVLAAAAVGVLRLPDFYTRSHAIGVTDTLGTLMILTGIAGIVGFGTACVKLVFLFLFIYLANPTVTHVLVRAALKSGLKPWTADAKKT
ncbi:MAG: monovalent cation/H(+) antiporter subunit G [Candidatus Omnitrophota bacterium]|nr:monovalent cation/H(+) antiporter subunit G [Candidatus Omnitrophota bacterium]